MNKIDISVIIPAYNREKYISKCIESVLSQKSVKAEIIIVDDGSEDHTFDICSNYAKKHSEIRVIHQENKGMAAARNAALAVAHGDYITFLDSDDCLAEDSLISMLTAIKEKDVDAVIGEYDVVTDEGEISGKGAIPAEYKKRLITDVEFWKINRDKQYNYLFTVVWGKLYRKEIWETLRFGDGLRFAEDEYILPELVDRCGSFYLLDKSVYVMTASEGSLTRSPFDKYKLTSPDSKLKICAYLMKRELMDCAVEKWGIAVGEVILMTKLVRDDESRRKVKNLFCETVRLGHQLFKYMDSKKKVKFIAYRIGYSIYSKINWK